MTYPSFSAGEILRAQDMNAVGMWLVKSQVIGSAVSSVTVTGAFSADYDRYKITVSGGVSSTPADLRLTLGSASSNYYGFLSYGAYNSSTVVGFNQSNTSSWGYVGTGSTDTLSANFELDNPFAAKRTIVTAQNALALAAGTANTFGGYLNDSTSYTAFTLTASVGNMTGGTIRVYGYKN
jgi:hypothetical protein